MRSGCDLSPAVVKMLTAMDEYLEESSKKEYRFTKEEQFELELMIKRLNNQVDMLVDYELKREK